MTSYREFATGKIRQTRGHFEGWSERTGPLQVRYAIFRNPRGCVCVPEYCLDAETRRTLGKGENVWPT